MKSEETITYKSGCTLYSKITSLGLSKTGKLEIKTTGYNGKYEVKQFRGKKRIKMLQRRQGQKNNLFTVTTLRCTMMTSPSDKQQFTIMTGLRTYFIEIT